MKKQGVKNMKLSKFSLIVLVSLGLMGLGACSNTNQATNPINSPSVAQSTQPSTQQSSETDAATEHAKVPQAGGQVVESGPYHLELVTEAEAEGTHLDLYLQKGDNHEAIPNAKVTAQIQLPDGTQKTLPLSYDAEGKHYTALLPGKVTGQHQVKISSDVGGDKADGRFSFNQ